jgi:hypothetical protein
MARMDALSSVPIEYRFRPRIVGAEHVFSLTPNSLEFESSRRRERIDYKDIVRVRLTYRPANMTLYRFIAEIWPRDGNKLTLVSVSANGPFHFENRGAAYRAFLLELFRRIGAAQPAFQIETGMARWRWLPAAIFGVATIIALLYVLGRALLNGQFSFFAFCLAFGALFVAQIGTMLLRNRPRNCAVASVPPEVLPSR